MRRRQAEGSREQGERLVKQVRWSVELRGVGGTVALMARRLLGRERGESGVERPVPPFDTEHGVETGGRIGGSHLGAGHPHDVYNTAYLGVPPSRLREALRLWRATTERPVEEYAFFDVGCGKGRAVMLASELAFREVSGVELDPELARVGRENLVAWARTGKARQRVEIVEGDATEVDLPALPCVVWLYNPFRAPVLRKLLERLQGHAGERRGVLDVIYVVPNHAEEFVRAGWGKVWEGGVRMSEEDREWDDSDVEDLGQVWRW